MLPSSPPLGNKLFPELMIFAPESWGNMPEHYANLFEKNFESGMGEVWSNRPEWLTAILVDMARYFSHFTAGVDSTYGSFIRKLQMLLKLSEITFSTLNYECIFESAVQACGLESDYSSNMQKGLGRVNLLKLHGSCNFVADGFIDPGQSIVTGHKIRLSLPIKPISLGDVEPYLRQVRVPTAMAVYAEGKPTDSCPEAIASLQDVWSQRVRDASVVGIVGVRPHPIDAHIWGPLADTPARLVVVGDKNAYESWAKGHRVHDTMIVGNRFAECLDDFVGQL